MTLHNPVESLVALPYRPTAALVVSSQKKYHCTSLTMICVLPDQLREEMMLLGTLASRVPSLVQSCSRPRCVEHFWDKHEQNTTFLERIMVGSFEGRWLRHCGTKASFIPFLPSKGNSHQCPTPPPQPAIPIHTPEVLGHCNRHVPAPQ